MASHAGAVPIEVFRKLIDMALDSIEPRESSDLPPLPFQWTNKVTGQEMTADDTDEFVVKFHIHPGGRTAHVEVQPVNSRCSTVYGTVNQSVLSTRLT